jgi:hypothetical protein
MSAKEVKAAASAKYCGAHQPIWAMRFKMIAL